MYNINSQVLKWHKPLSGSLSQRNLKLLTGWNALSIGHNRYGSMQQLTTALNKSAKCSTTLYTMYVGRKLSSP